MPGLADNFSHDNRYNQRHFGAVHQLFYDDRKKNWSSRRHWVANVVESFQSDIFMGLIITLNTVLVIIETDLDAKQEDTSYWMRVVSRIMIGIYTVELLARLYVYQSFFCHNGWNIFDTIVVASDLISEFIQYFLSDVIPSVSLLKVFRLGRLLRFVCVLTMFEDLNKMVSLMLASCFTLAWGFFVLLCIITGWSIVAVQFIHPVNTELAEAGYYADCPHCARAFSSVAQSNLTLFKHLVFGDSWGEVSVKLIENRPWTAIILISAGIAIQIGVLNLILTVIVEKAHDEKQRDQIGKLKAKASQFAAAKDGLSSLCGKIDKDGNGMISVDELQSGFQSDPEFALLISMMDLTEEDLLGVYSMLDDDGSGYVTSEEFVEQMYKIKTQDVRAIILFIKGKQNELRNDMQRRMDDIREDLKFMMNQMAGKTAQENRFEVRGSKVDLPEDIAMGPLASLMSEGSTPAGMTDTLDRSSLASLLSEDAIRSGMTDTQDRFRLALRDELPQLLEKAVHNIDKQIASTFTKALNETGVLQQKKSIANGVSGMSSAVDELQGELVCGIPELTKVVEDQMLTLRETLCLRIEDIWVTWLQREHQDRRVFYDL